MSVLIKGMKMPENCFNCRFSRWDVEGGFCDLLNEDADMRFKRHDDCPLIPVPAHGRLVDADDVIAEARSGNYWWETEEEIPGLLNEVPTIIPAERSEE